MDDRGLYSGCHDYDHGCYSRLLDHSIYSNKVWCYFQSKLSLSSLETRLELEVAVRIYSSSNPRIYLMVELLQAH